MSMPFNYFNAISQTASSSSTPFGVKPETKGTTPADNYDHPDNFEFQPGDANSRNKDLQPQDFCTVAQTSTPDWEADDPVDVTSSSGILYHEGVHPTPAISSSRSFQGGLVVNALPSRVIRDIFPPAATMPLHRTLHPAASRFRESQPTAQPLHYTHHPHLFHNPQQYDTYPPSLIHQHPSNCVQPHFMPAYQPHPPALAQFHQLLSPITANQTYLPPQLSILSPTSWYSQLAPASDTPAGASTSANGAFLSIENGENRLKRSREDIDSNDELRTIRLPAKKQGVIKEDKKGQHSAHSSAEELALQTIDITSEDDHDQEAFLAAKEVPQAAVPLVEGRATSSPKGTHTAVTPLAASDEGAAETDDQSPSYYCAQCKSSFMRHADLQRHLRTVKAHNPTYLYPCPHCTNSFTRADDCKQHVQNRH
ncbi:hypothetical protein EW146_g2611 [Bondarzewia mesenterica]|uniref:C2H2-type domain-containing protein n=1 Tax=Bondarzewia mesenterica TaxID=1095465 RepID=A0A4S4M2E1_9AGAM|nr:hypothetical protein EW146_g2611 [Bondarzewia mesenterica]